MVLMWLEIGGEVRVVVRRFCQVVRYKMENFGEGIFQALAARRASEGRGAIVKCNSVDSGIFYHREVSPGWRHGLPT